MYKAIKITGEKRNDLIIFEAVGFRHTSSERFRARIKNSVGHYVVIRKHDNNMIYDGVQDVATLKTLFSNVDKVNGSGFLVMEYHG